MCGFCKFFMHSCQRLWNLKLQTQAQKNLNPIMLFLKRMGKVTSGQAFLRGITTVVTKCTKLQESKHISLSVIMVRDSRERESARAYKSLD